MNHVSIPNPARASLNGPLTTYQAGNLQSAAHRLLQKYCDDLLRPYDITKMQWLIIGAVLDAGNDGIRITELAASLSTTLSYLTNTINLLETKDILQRISDQQDERSKKVSVNPAFISTCTEIEEKLRTELRRTIYANVTPQEFRIYIQVLQKLTKIG